MKPRTKQQKRLDKQPALTDVERDQVQNMLLHEDAERLVFNKPAGLPVQTRRTDDHTLDRLLWAFAKSNGKRPKLVHRLDSETSGVIVVARTQPVAATLSDAFAKRQVQKTYLALVGAPNASALDFETRLIDCPLIRFRDPSGMELSRPSRPSEQGQSAKTQVRLLSKTNDIALIEAKPETGRMHQIRAHLAEIGLPILGDLNYGGRSHVVGKAVPRTLLHALAIELPDGSNYEAPVPEDFLTMAAHCGLAIPAKTA